MKVLKTNKELKETYPVLTAGEVYYVMEDGSVHFRTDIISGKFQEYSVVPGKNNKKR